MAMCSRVLSPFYFCSFSCVIYVESTLHVVVHFLVFALYTHMSHRQQHLAEIAVVRFVPGYLYWAKSLRVTKSDLVECGHIIALCSW